MNRSEDEALRDAREREDLQNSMARWGKLPVPVVPSDVVEQRRARGLITLRAAIGSAGRERQTRRMRMALGVVAAAALLTWGGFGLFGLVQSGPRSLAEIQSTERSVSPAGARPHASLGSPSEVWNGDGWVSAEAGQTLYAGARVRALGKPVDLHLARITSARVAPGSVIAIAILQPRLQEVRVEKGSADFEVDPKRDAQVIVHTANARVFVTGTAFSVTSGGAGGSAWSEVAVTRGRVEIASGGKSFVLEPGDSWSSQAAATSGGTEHTGKRALDRESAQAGAAISGAADDREVSTRAKTHGGPTGGSGHPRASTAVSESAGGLADGLLTTLSEENRLFRSALSARNGGNGGRCVALLSELLTKFPSSPLRQDAMVAQFRCLRLSNNTAAAHRSAARYLSEYPNGFARDEARGLVLDVAP